MASHDPDVFGDGTLKEKTNIQKRQGKQEYKKEMIANGIIWGQNARVELDKIG